MVSPVESLAGEPVAIWIVGVAGGLTVLGESREVAFGIPGEGLAGFGHHVAGGGIASGVVAVGAAAGGGPGGGDGRDGVRLRLPRGWVAGGVRGVAGGLVCDLGFTVADGVVGVAGPVRVGPADVGLARGGSAVAGDGVGDGPGFFEVAYALVAEAFGVRAAVCFGGPLGHDYAGGGLGGVRG